MNDAVSAQRRAEIAAKLQRLRALMRHRNVDALYLTSIANTAWLTAGAATYVDESVDSAACSLFVSQDEAVVLTDPIEEPRLRAEERLDALGFRFAVEPWHRRGESLRQWGMARRLASDQPGRGAIDLSGALLTLRSQLTEGEQQRLREGAQRAAAAMWEAARTLAPGMSEHDAAAALAGASRKRGGTATVILVASDDRIASYRHPLPTDKAIERHVMLVLCFRYRGLVSALTRTLYFGEAPEALRQLTAAVARVDARVIAATRAGRTLGELFEVARAAYAHENAEDAIEQHHQGGTIGYLGRETLARPGSLTRVEVGQAFAWNPSLRGAKSEDTMLLTAHGPEILTAMEGWPTLHIETDADSIERPAILEVDPA